MSEQSRCKCCKCSLPVPSWKYCEMCDSATSKARKEKLEVQEVGMKIFLARKKRQELLRREINKRSQNRYYQIVREKSLAQKSLKRKMCEPERDRERAVRKLLRGFEKFDSLKDKETALTELD